MSLLTSLLLLGDFPITVKVVLGNESNIFGKDLIKYFKPFNGISALAVVMILFSSLLSKVLVVNVFISIPFKMTSILLGSTLNSSITSSFEGLLTHMIFFSFGATLFCMGRKLCHRIEDSFSFQLEAFCIS